MGLALANLRGSGDTISRPEHDRDIVVQVSARRVIAAWRQGYAPNEKWRLRFSAQDADIRQIPDRLEPENFIDLDDGEAFDLQLNYILNRLISNYELTGDDLQGWGSDLYKKAFAAIGLDYTVVDSDEGTRIKVGDTGLLRNALRLFRNSVATS